MTAASGSSPDFDAFVRGYAAGSIGDAEMSRWLREVYERGLSDDDTFALTVALARSGEVIDWSDVREPVVDKHSTGGVGDAVTPIAVPLAAACGVRVAKLSGRALGHTGGTLDKLECIPGLRTDLSIERFKQQVTKVGCAVAAATSAIAPAEKKLYDLRHRTGTIASVPLIASSIMSKKIAAGARCIVLDVKFGEGAFMETLQDAETLARAMHAIGTRAGLSVNTLLTSMDEPLADSVGDALELDEALLVLENRGGSVPLREVACGVAAAMLESAGLVSDAVERALRDGSGRRTFDAMVAAQGGDLRSFDRSWPEPQVVSSTRAGMVARIDARKLGEMVAEAKERVGARDSARVGVRLLRRCGDGVREGEALLHAWLPPGPADGARLDGVFTIADVASPMPPRVIRGAPSAKNSG